MHPLPHAMLYLRQAECEDLWVYDGRVEDCSEKPLPADAVYCLPCSARRATEGLTAVEITELYGAIAEARGGASR